MLKREPRGIPPFQWLWNNLRISLGFLLIIYLHLSLILTNEYTLVSHNLSNLFYQLIWGCFYFLFLSNNSYTCRLTYTCETCAPVRGQLWRPYTNGKTLISLIDKWKVIFYFLFYFSALQIHSAYQYSVISSRNFNQI